MKFSKREGILVALCVVVVVAIGIPSIEQLMGMGGGKSAAQLATEKQIADRECQRLRGEIDAADQEVKGLTWPDSADKLPPQLLVDLHDAAKRAGVSLGSFRPAKVVPAAGGSKLPITVEITAPFPRAVAFLSELHRRSDRVALERLQVASTDASTDTVAMELRLVAYSAEVLAAPAAKRSGSTAAKPAASNKEL